MRKDEAVSKLPTPSSPEVEAEVLQSDPELKGTQGNSEDFEKLLDTAAEVLGDNREDLAAGINAAECSQYFYRGVLMMKSEKDEGRLELRSKQAILHLAFTEIRITELERELQALKTRVFNLPAKTEQKCLVCQPILKRSEAEEFRFTVASTKIPMQERPALEVLYSNVIPAYDLGSADPP
ncbi:hypothetical protein EDB81DRAFT_885330 [Dactylonectria macrodidyma]|uniref:Uncharacterized protein n=1 Tax=Dactylonectria macrodidyma TaxID=307937 RepID=A0A9P9EP12_9HYPO|nr:hypothetical protein EDB81DRAFT_885330 [Dactylonectria macrodidyma]